MENITVISHRVTQMAGCLKPSERVCKEGGSAGSIRTGIYRIIIFSTSCEKALNMCFIDLSK